MWGQALTVTLDCWFESNPAKLDWCLALTHPTYCYICCERSRAPVWTHPQLPREHHIYPPLCHTSRGSLFYVFTWGLLMHVPVLYLQVWIHLVLKFSVWMCRSHHVFLLFFSLLKPPGTSAMMLLHHNRHRTSHAAIIQPGKGPR